ncbi:heat shock protein transcriptional repressor HspR [Arcanobacterium buesumense]|uniref:MerR family transcriptional regulator n=1 Tax=Arcanobacterium buesumense TaxID=2722751 RepID=A0A6H2EJQ6_9ACTO|nr:MerR family transcriptional regulator [Arcanobacterium buesumense]QJC21203.1 MerR family transcriptional regulator [Arcanobacterium buesumense]
MAKVANSAPILTVSVAAELAGMHAQTVRQYDRLGLVVAKRTRGGGRRYSLNDVERLTEIQRLSQEEGINLAGIARIFELRDELAKLASAKSAIEQQLIDLRNEHTLIQEQIRTQRERQERVFAVNSSGQVEASGSIETLRRTLRAAREDERHRSAHTVQEVHAHDRGTAVVPSSQQLDWLLELLEQHMYDRLSHRQLKLVGTSSVTNEDDDAEILDVNEIIL